MSSSTLNQTTSASSSHQQFFYLTSTALFAALICITTAFIFHIPYGINGGYVHIGDALIYLAASILPLPYAMVAGAIGGAMADLLTAPVWAPATFIIKMMIAIPFTRKKDKFITLQNIIGLFVAFLISMIGYYVAEAILFHSWAAIVPAFVGSFIQSFGSALVYVALGTSLDRMNFKKRFSL